MKKLIPLIFILNFSIKAQDVKIGTQTWTSKNLDVSTYRNGDVIPQVKEEEAWANLQTGAWCYYENKSANGTKYGKLYNWYAVNDPRGLAPKGYHIPTVAEWTILTDYLGGKKIAAQKMKSTSGWLKNGEGTDIYGFAGLPGGERRVLGDFSTSAFWWSSTEWDRSYSCGYCFYYIFNNVSSIQPNKHSGLSVRCIKD